MLCTDYSIRAHEESTILYPHITGERLRIRKMKQLAHKASVTEVPYIFKFLYFICTFYLRLNTLQCLQSQGKPFPEAIAPVFMIFFYCLPPHLQSASLSPHLHSPRACVLTVWMKCLVFSRNSPNGNRLVP